MRTLLPLLFLAAGCGWEEEILEKDLTGTVLIPVDLTGRFVDLDGDGQSDDLDGDGDLDDDDRLYSPEHIGPIYLGAFPAVEDLSFGYTHPEIGPVLSDLGGNTFPYGGTSVGRVEAACLSQTACKITTGRFETAADLIRYYSEIVQDPLIWPDDTVVWDRGDYSSDEEADAALAEAETSFLDFCFEKYNFTSEIELEVIGGLDFTETVEIDGREYYQAEFTMWHTPVYDGMRLWGFVDMPSSSFDLSTCTADSSGQLDEYFQDEWYQGTSFQDVLNFPSRYITSGDVVSSDAGSPTVSDPEQDYQIILDEEVSQ